MTPHPLSARPILLSAISLLSAGGLSYLLHREIRRFDGPHPALSSSSSTRDKSPYPVSKLYPPPTGDITRSAQVAGYGDGDGAARHVEDKGLMLTPSQALRAGEDDTLIENIVLYLG